MRILILNPNTTEPVTDILVAAAHPAAAAGTELVGMTASRGVPYIASRAEAQIGGTIALEMLAEQHRNVDAAIIAAFGDPGLLGARAVRHSGDRHGGGGDAGRLHARTALRYRHLLRHHEQLVPGHGRHIPSRPALRRHPRPQPFLLGDRECAGRKGGGTAGAGARSRGTGWSGRRHSGWCAACGTGTTDTRSRPCSAGRSDCRCGQDGGSRGRAGAPQSNGGYVQPTAGQADERRSVAR